MTPTDPELVAKLREPMPLELPAWVREWFTEAADALESAHQREGGLLFTIAACDAELAKLRARAQQLEAGADGTAGGWRLQCCIDR